MQMNVFFLPLSTLTVFCCLVLAWLPLHVSAQTPTLLRISSAAVPQDWHAKMWTVFKDKLQATAPAEFNVQIHLNSSLFKQAAEAAAMARGNLELSTLSPSDLSRQVPYFSVFTAGYVLRDLAHQQKVFNGPIGEEGFKQVSERMGIKILATAYLGTRQLVLRQARDVKTPADLKGLKLRMPASKEWLYLGEALGATATPLSFAEVYMALKTGTIDAQDNPLPTVRAARFHEVSQQVVLTAHLVDALFIAISQKTWDALTPTQRQKVQQAAQDAARYNNEQRLAEEKNILDYMKQQGLRITTPDVAAFKQQVTQRYKSSDLAATWPPGLLARIEAVR
jgi:tripartite ATP-independent transporter DctP family solute receptor